MHKKTSGKLLLTLVLTVLLTEFLRINKEIFAEQPVINILVSISCIVSVSLLWAYLVIIKDKKKYDIQKQAAAERKKDLDLDNKYDELCKEHREYLEKKRKIQRDRRVLKYSAIAVMGSCAFGMISFMASGSVEKATDLISIFLIAFAVLLAAISTEKEREMEYKAAYKLRIISSLLKYINPKLEYEDTSPEREQLLNEYDTANFGLAVHTKIECLDKIKGLINDKKYTDMLELKLSSELENGTKHPTLIEIFNGFFTKINGERNWDFKLKVSSVGISSRAAIYEQGTRRIKLDNGEFMEKFIVQTNEKLIATRILTSDIIEMFINYREKYGVDFDIAIKNGDIYFLFYTGDLFEPDVLTDSMKKDLILNEYSVLKLIIDLMQKMETVVEDIYNSK